MATGLSGSAGRAIARLRRAAAQEGPLTDVGVLGWVLFAIAALLVMLAVALAVAPASFADFAVRRATEGRVRLADARGTIWSGRAHVVLVDVVTERDRADRADEVDAGGPRGAAALAGVVIPGWVDWQVDTLPLLIGRLQAKVSHESMPGPVRVDGSGSLLTVGAGRMQLPSVSLAKLGSPWNTVQPTGALSLDWQPLRVENGALIGKAGFELRDIGSALTPVRPLGAFRVDIDAGPGQAQLQMKPIEGPLRLSGSGNWTPRGGLRFTAEAVPDASDRSRLNALLTLMGVRDGDKTIIKIGA